MRSMRHVLLVGCCLTFWLGVSRVAFTQQVWVRAYEDQEDLWESYREGELTSDQYLDLLALFQAGADSIFQPASDLEELPGYSASDSVGFAPVSVKAVDGRPSRGGRYELRAGYTLPLREQSDEGGYIVARRRSRRVQAFFDARSEQGRYEGFRKRGITLVSPGRRTQVTIGNYEPRYGLGLVVGRRDRVLGRTENTNLSGSVWQPRRGNFNGLDVQSTLAEDLNLIGSASRIENGRYREDIIASQISVTPGDAKVELGLTGAAYRMSDRASTERFRRSAVGLALKAGDNRQRVQLETAVVDGGAVAAAGRAERPLAAGRVSLVVWTYDRAFILPSSGGPGHPGRQRISLFGEGLDYYSRTAGEQGLLLDVRSRLSEQVDVESVLEIFNDRLARAKNFEGILALRVKPSGRTSLRLYLRGRAEHGEDGDDRRMYVGISGRTGAGIMQPVTWRIETGARTQPQQAQQRSVRLELGSAIALNSAVRLTPRVRYVDPDLASPADGYWYVYLTETISAWRGFELEIIVAGRGFEDSARHSFADVRIRTTWRP